MNNPAQNFQLILTDDIKYFVYQLEEATTPHMQGYFIIKGRKSMSQVKRLLPGCMIGCHLEPRKGTHAQAKKYCTKNETRKAGPWEAGVEPKQGSRSDLSEGLRLTLQGATFQEIHDTIGVSAIRYKRHLREAADEILREENLKKMKLEFHEAVLREWQKKLWDKLTETPDPRKIMWYTDIEGNQGKTWFSKYLITNSSAVVYGNGKSADIKYAYNGERVVIFDLCRSCEERVNYEILESIKNGVFFSAKYTSCSKIYPIPHVIVFSNFGPDRTKLSSDRWDVNNLINFI